MAQAAGTAATRGARFPAHGPSLMSRRSQPHTWETSASKKSSHSWERAAVDDGADDTFWGELSDSDEDTDTPGQRLVDKLIHVHLLNKISAEDCCTALHDASEAGVSEATKYGKAPGSSSGKYAEKLRSVLGQLDSSDLYEFEYPGHHRHALSRMVHVGHCLPAHEQVAADTDDAVGFRTRLLELVRGRLLPPAYFDHPVVKAAGSDLVVPLALYVDAVPYSLNDSVIGWWMVNLVTGKRYLWGLLRKQHACRCGCRIWDSCFAFFRLVVWFLLALAAGRFPCERHDGTPFPPSDKARAELAGKSLPFKAACIFVKGDWSEFSTTFGFPSWADGLRPCFDCNAHGADQYIAAGNSADHLRWRINGDADYGASCQQCLHTVHVPTVDVRNRIASRLRYDKRKAGSNGRALSNGIPELHLEADDRLEPSESVPDAGSFEVLAPPFTALFWRRSLESHSRRPNPLFLSNLGITSRSLAVDTLHAFYLGVMKVWAAITVWHILQSGIYGAAGTGDENVSVAILSMRSALMSFYKSRHAQHPAEGLTRVPDFSAKTVGSKAKQVLKTKGAETYGFMKFLIQTLTLYRERVGPHWQRLLLAGECLDRIVDIWQTCDWIIPEQQREEGMRLYCKHVALMVVFDCFVPKHHLVFHLLH